MPYEEPVVYITITGIDHAILLYRARLQRNAEEYLNSFVEDICTTGRPRFPFPWPIPRDFTNEDYGFSPDELQLAAAEFDKAAGATTDPGLRKLLLDQIAKLTRGDGQ